MSNQIIKVFLGFKPAVLPSFKNHKGVMDALGVYGLVNAICPPEGFAAAYKLQSHRAYEITFNEINNRLLAGIELDTPYVVVMINNREAEAHFSLSISEEKKTELLQNINDFQPNV